jgi:hypothetical protein
VGDLVVTSNMKREVMVRIANLKGFVVLFTAGVGF